MNVATTNSLCVQKLIQIQVAGMELSSYIKLCFCLGSMHKLEKLKWPSSASETNFKFLTIFSKTLLNWFIYNSGNENEQAEKKKKKKGGAKWKRDWCCPLLSPGLPTAGFCPTDCGIYSWPRECFPWYKNKNSHVCPKCSHFLEPRLS